MNRIIRYLFLCLLIITYSCEKTDDTGIFKLPEKGFNEYIIYEGEQQSYPRHAGHTVFTSDTFQIKIQFDTSILFVDTQSYKSKISGIYEDEGNSIRLAYQNKTDTAISNHSDTLSLFWYLHQNGQIVSKYITSLSYDEITSMNQLNTNRVVKIICTADQYIASYDSFPSARFERKSYQVPQNEKSLHQPYHGGSNTQAPHDLIFRIDYADMIFYRKN